MSTSTSPTLDRTVAIIGAGRVGSALGSLLRQVGVTVTAVTTRHEFTARAAALSTGGEPLTDNTAASRTANIVLVAVPDDSVARVVREIAAGGGFSAGQVVAHVSGALGLEVLSPAAEAGAATGCLHPAQSFANVEHAIREIPGSVFGITADEDARVTLEALVALVGGVPVLVSDGERPLYHAASVMASNYLVVLADMAGELFERAGLSPQEARLALGPLVRGTATNIAVAGTRGALTGPVARGDIGTVRAHLAALESVPAEIRQTYRLLGLRAAEMAAETGRVDEEAAGELARLLGGDPTL
jgi:predicted short-subunit dehydrogenase-like oxidoreductase (DUF2520 family)